MPDFSYVARNNDGEKVTGTLEAGTRGEALAAIAARALFPIEVEARSVDLQDKAVRRISGQLKARLFSQLADLLKSGVPLLRALHVIEDQTSHAGLKNVLSQIQRFIEEGSTLAEAMGRFPRVFGEMPISMVRAGSEGGFLEESLVQVSEFTEAQEDLKKRVVGALIYPVVLAVFGTLIVSVLMVAFVPKFETMFDSLREQGKLPPLTDWLLATSAIMQTWGVFVVPLLIAAAVALQRWTLTERGRRAFDKFKISVPILGPVFLSLAVARFCRVLGTLLHNGVPILRSLEISSDSTGNRILGDAIQDATENISAGESLASPLGASGSFPSDVVEMISVAEESNTLDTVLVGIAESLEKQTWRKLDVAVRLLEPLMLVALASVVLVLVIALMLPIFKMSEIL